MISAKVAPFFRWSMATTWAVLLPSRVPALLGDLAAFLAGVVFLPLAVGLALALPPLALFWPVGAAFFWPAVRFVGAFSAATVAAGSATAAAWAVRVVSWFFINT